MSDISIRGASKYATVVQHVPRSVVLAAHGTSKSAASSIKPAVSLTHGSKAKFNRTAISQTEQRTQINRATTYETGSQKEKKTRAQALETPATKKPTASEATAQETTTQRSAAPKLLCSKLHSQKLP